MKILRRKLTLPDYYMIAANLLPLYGVWFLQWSAWEVFAVYTLETIIIGLFTILKLTMASFAKGNDNWHNNGKKTRVSGLFFILFFFVHYGLFVGVQMAIFFNISGMLDKKNIGLLEFVLSPHRHLSKEALLMLLVFTIGYGLKMMTEFVASGRYKTAPMMVLMFEPYGRIFIQQFTVIAGSFFVLFGAGKIFILVFTAVKIYVSVIINFDAYVQKAVEKQMVQESSNSHS